MPNSTKMDPPKEPTKPDVQDASDAALAASAANAVEQWRTYQNAYTLYQQQQAAYDDYMRKQATLTSYEEQQIAYSQYLEAHTHYQKQLEQYEHQKVYQEYYVTAGGAAVPAGVGNFYPTTTAYPPPALSVPPVFTTPLANVDSFYNKANDHYRNPSGMKQRSEASIRRAKVYTSTNYYLNPEDEQMFPEEMKVLFKEFDCGLCKCKMNSHISANVHYQSKVHEKKINQWLKDWCERTGTPMPYRVKRKTAPVEPVGPNSLRCEACDLPLTSVQHANQHYTGKRHQMVIRGKKNPTGRGQYREDGSWTRSVTNSDENPDRFGIGSSFSKQKVRFNARDAKRMRLEPPPSPPPGVKEVLLGETGSVPLVTPSFPVPVASSYTTPVAQIRPVDKMYGSPGVSKVKFAPEKGSILEVTKTIQAEVKKKEGNDCVDESGIFCKVCQIGVTSVAVMETHLKGIKHLKKLKSVGRMPPPGHKGGNSIDSILSTLNKPPQQNDWSLYRMPSGKYYCKSCNSILADEKLFSQHWYGKKHKLKVKQEMDELTGATEKKPKFFNRRPVGKGRFVQPQQM